MAQDDVTEFVGDGESESVRDSCCCGPEGLRVASPTVTAMACMDWDVSGSTWR